MSTSTTYQFNNTEKEYLYELMKIGCVTIEPAKVIATTRGEFDFTSINEQNMKLPINWQLEKIKVNADTCTIEYNVKR